MRCTLMFRQKKTTDWIWIAVDIARKRYLIGNRATASGMRLWDNKRDTNEFTNELLLYRLPEKL